jgi:hypothetical protein
LLFREKEHSVCRSSTAKKKKKKEEEESFKRTGEGLGEGLL